MTSIHPSATIIGDVTIGLGSSIGPNAVIYGPVSIGSHCVIGASSVIGAPPQDDALSIAEHRKILSGEASDRETIIGSNNVIREFVTIHRGTTHSTMIGDSNYLMAYTHVGHDCAIGSHCKITNAVQLGGFVTVMDGAYIGLLSAVHQFAIIGGLSIVGMSSAVGRDVLPGSKVLGAPARLIGPNLVALEAAGISGRDWWTNYVAGNLTEVPVAVTELRRSWDAERLARDQRREKVTEVRARQLEALKQFES